MEQLEGPNSQRSRHKFLLPGFIWVLSLPFGLNQVVSVDLPLFDCLLHQVGETCPVAPIGTVRGLKLGATHANNSNHAGSGNSSQ